MRDDKEVEPGQEVKITPTNWIIKQKIEEEKLHDRYRHKEHLVGTVKHVTVKAIKIKLPKWWPPIWLPKSQIERLRVLKAHKKLGEEYEISEGK